MVMPDDVLLDGSPNKSGLLGCLLSHLNVMKIALSRKQEQILIFEDDVSFHKDAPLLLKNFVESCKQLSLNFKDLNIIHLGYLPVVKKAVDIATGGGSMSAGKVSRKLDSFVM
jgi:hypothetical protein